MSLDPIIYNSSHLWDVLKLFLIPIGGGIPSGVLKARDHGFVWPITLFLYFISDLILAIVFEPLLKVFLFYSKKSPKLTLIGEAFKQNITKTTEHFGATGGALTLILISFGVDPMTGRSVAVAVGRGTFMGWVFAITGDLFYFAVLMISTLWLDGILGDGTVTTLIILVLMFFVPALIKKMRMRKLKQ